MTTKGGERYILITPTTDYVLPGSTKPSALAQTQRTPQYIRAFGRPEIFDIGDTLPNATPIELKLTIKKGSEDELALYLSELRQIVKTTTAISRNDRLQIDVRNGSLFAAPISNASNEAEITITFTPLRVPTDGGIYDW